MLWVVVLWEICLIVDVVDGCMMRQMLGGIADCRMVEEIRKECMVVMHVVWNLFSGGRHGLLFSGRRG